MMLPSSSWACTRPTGVGEKTKKEKGKKLAGPDYFEVSSYPERDRVDKAPLVFLQFLYSPPSLPPSLTEAQPYTRCFDWLL